MQREVDIYATAAEQLFISRQANGTHDPACFSISVAAPYPSRGEEKVVFSDFFMPEGRRLGELWFGPNEYLTCRRVGKDTLDENCNHRVMALLLMSEISKDMSMSEFVWHTGAPPHVGWWSASPHRSVVSWKWWDGDCWSVDYSPPDDVSAPKPSHWEDDAYPIYWRYYWPYGARVDRINPDTGESTGIALQSRHKV